MQPKTLSRRTTVVTAIIAVLVVAAGVEEFRKYRERVSEPPWPVAVCFPERSVPASRALEGEFEIITRVKRIPANIQPAFKERNGRRWAIANPDEGFEPTDYHTDSLPIRRLVFAGRSRELTFVHYEQGGWGLGHVVAAFRTSSSTIDPLWRRHCPRDAANLDELRDMIAAGQCPTEAEWHEGSACTNRLR